MLRWFGYVQSSYEVHWLELIGIQIDRNTILMEQELGGGHKWMWTKAVEKKMKAVF